MGALWNVYVSRDSSLLLQPYLAYIRLSGFDDITLSQKQETSMARI